VHRYRFYRHFVAIRDPDEADSSLQARILGNPGGSAKQKARKKFAIALEHI
jgi:hypothetical protein